MSARDLLQADAMPLAAWAASGVAVAELAALADQGRTPMVLHPSGLAVSARTTVELHGAHIGRRVVLMFEGGNPALPIVMGVLCGGDDEGLPTAAPPPGQVELDADGSTLVVAAKERLVMRCGKASITLTAAGKVLIEGAYLLSRSTGVNRVKGGSVQLN